MNPLQLYGQKDEFLGCFNRVEPGDHIGIVAVTVDEVVVVGFEMFVASVVVIVAELAVISVVDVVVGNVVVELVVSVLVLVDVVVVVALDKDETGCSRVEIEEPVLVSVVSVNGVVARLAAVDEPSDAHLSPKPPEIVKFQSFQILQELVIPGFTFNCIVYSYVISSAAITQ